MSDHKSENSKVTKAAGVVGMATLLSRILGFVRDVVTATFLGAGFYSDVFFVAFRIPNVLRRLFAEGSLSVAFVPVFTDLLVQKGKSEAYQMAKAAIWLLLIILTGVASLCILFSPMIVKVIAPGFTITYEKYAITVTLTRILFPYIVFIGLVALCMGILNTLGHFAAPALAPVVLNISMITAILIGVHYYSDQESIVKTLAYGVVVGGILQLSLQIPFILSRGIKFWKNISFYHPELKKVMVLLLPTILGAAVYQINVLVNTILASLLAEGSVSFLYYADRLVQFPLGVFAIAMATAVLPSISRLSSANDFKRIRQTFSYSMNLVFFIIIPAMIGLIVLRTPIVMLLFERGAFDHQSTELTAAALLYYGLGLWAFAAVRIVLAIYYALKDTKTPVVTAIISMIANIVAGIVLMQFMGHCGLALATSIASMINIALLISLLRRRIGTINWRPMIFSVTKTTVSSLIMGACIYEIFQWLMTFPIPHSIHLLISLITSMIMGIVIYLAVSFCFKSQELVGILSVIRRNNNA